MLYLVKNLSYGWLFMLNNSYFSTSLFFYEDLSAIKSLSHLHDLPLGIIWCLPFCFLLLSIAFFPLFFSKFWHNHYGKICAICASLCIVPLLIFTNFSFISHEVLHTFFYHYFPFICLVGALFTVGGGIQIVLRGQSTPIANTIFLASGALLTNLIGTTGASMLLIRPFLAINHYRSRKTHAVIFFIFLISNIGGTLTPLGDPPLFLGFLKDIDFLWPLKNLFEPYFLVVGLLLFIFYCIDFYYFKHDPKINLEHQDRSHKKIQVSGKRNFIFLIIIPIIILLNGTSQFHKTIEIGSVPVEIKDLLRELSLLCLIFLSLKITPKKIYEHNQFSWEPLKEVAKIFAAIFITILPVTAILQAGHKGPLGFIIDIVNPNGVPNNMLYFWMCGMLSGFLDNAPTYLIFFEIAGGDPVALMGPLSKTLMAISLGAVFMGAFSYIGNAPNFMIKSIAKNYHIKMPSFVGYMGWSSIILLPVFILMNIFFF